jgi:hypothetical protein
MRTKPPPKPVLDRSSRLGFRIRCVDGDDDPQGVGDVLGGSQDARRADDGGDGHQDVLNLLELHPSLHRRTHVHQVRGGRGADGGEGGDTHQEHRDRIEVGSVQCGGVDLEESLEYGCVSGSHERPLP